MNRNDLDEAMKNIDNDLVKETANKKPKKFWIGFGISAASIVLAVTVLTSFLISGMFKNPVKNDGYKDGVIGEKKETIGDKIRDFIDGVIPGSSGSAFKYEMDSGAPAPMPGSKDAAYASDAKYGGADEFMEVPSEGLYYDRDITGMNADPVAGTLTAGEWRDIDNLSDWFKLINDNNWYPYAENRALYTNKAVTVVVKDGDAACFNVKVELKDGDKVIGTGRTDINGKVRIFYNLNKEGFDPTAVTVNGKSFDLTSDYIEVEAKNAGVKLQQIDLMYMIDTTGSMGDEITYLQAELVDMVERIAAKDQSVSIRVSVNFYKDADDEYIVKYFDFREDINQCLEQIKNESASGGGDFPEAVHTALDNAVTGHNWREDALKLCFFVLDAPPHDESEIQGINAQIRESLVKAADLGIRIVPVFCSGADQASEYLFRSFAVITNGTFVFLTNDSGVGGDHLETSVGEYKVEKLNDCMVRIVCEFAGFTYQEPVQNSQGQQDVPQQ